MIATRSPIAQLGVRAASPLAVVVALYLLFAGHNRPGGGFAAGLVLGAVVTLRSLTGLPLPKLGTPLIAGGITIIAVTAIAPVLWGDVWLDQAIVSTTVPVLGKVKTGTALIFDIGVVAVVVGLVVALIDTATVTDHPTTSKQELQEHV